MSYGSEQWRPIPGCLVLDGRPAYEVSSQGRVRSWMRQAHSRSRRGRVLRHEPVLVGSDSGRYSTVGFIRADGSPSKNQQIHALVMLVFEGPRPEGLEVCHNNGENHDNRFSNLRYDTHQANVDDAKRHGTIRFGEANARAVLTDQLVSNARTMVRAGLTVRDTADELGLTYNRVYGCVYKKPGERGTWSHVLPEAIEHVARPYSRNVA